MRIRDEDARNTASPELTRAVACGHPPGEEPVMSDRFISRGFHQKREGAPKGRIPPGQYLERGFPVLSAGPTPRTPLERWDFTIEGEVDRPRRWTWQEFRALPH